MKRALATVTDARNQPDTSDPQTDAVASLLREQIAYYRARADEYDATSWDGEPARDALRAALAEAAPRGDVLELACGTGAWTRELARQAQSLTAVDASPEMLARAQRELGGQAVEFVCADLFAWRPSRRYDVIFFSAWLSHVPLQRFDAFWAMLRDALASDGRVLCIDETPAAAEHERFVADAGEPAVQRRLRSGERYRAVKVLWSPADLVRRLDTLDWETTIRSVGERFYLLTARVRDPG